MLDLLNFRQHQQQQLELHQRARRVWGLCAVFMTAVAIVSVAIAALGLSALTGGVVVAVASCITLFGSALYRHKPDVFDNTVISIKNNINSFFKTQYPAHQALDPMTNPIFSAATISG